MGGKEKTFHANLLKGYIARDRDAGQATTDERPQTSSSAIPAASVTLIEDLGGEHFNDSDCEALPELGNKGHKNNDVWCKVKSRYSKSVDEENGGDEEEEERDRESILFFRVACSTRRMDLRIQTSVIFLWSFYQLIFGPSITICASELSSFINANIRNVTCESEPLLLKPSPSTYLECARECKRQTGCTAFTFTPDNVSHRGTGLKLGLCSWCPANNIVNVSYTATDLHLKTWYNVLGHLVQPPDLTMLEIPGALSVGRYLIVYGRIPDPLPSLSRVTIFPQQGSDIAARVAPHFNQTLDSKAPVIELLKINCKINGTFYMNTFEDIFPFWAGQTFEIGFLATRTGFAVYIDGTYMITITTTSYMVGDIGFISSENVELLMITF
ncbi:gypsy retrotransposon integrase-like protein 1 [Plakobranchus ocellatus]|uniref:Galectin n=1 Tax=Plakobranchus ocellatus TaxID=259542 RepID=A0AAV4DJL0_9GAST|nr:gypsy retrotransposon integrase-like protein 1 [Plakobranchus ocellatus]